MSRHLLLLTVVALAAGARLAPAQATTGTARPPGPTLPAPTRRPAPTLPAPTSPATQAVRTHLFVLARGDSTFVFIDSVAPRGHAWRVVRGDGRVIAEGLAPEPSVDATATRLGSALPLAWRLTRAEDEVALQRRLVSERNVAFTGLLLSREIADVTGRLAADGAPVAGAASYRAELVRRSDGAVRATLATIAPVGRPAIAVPDGLVATTRVEGVDLGWRYPRYAGTPEDVVVGFVIERARGEGEFQRVEGDPVLRDDSHPLRWRDGDVVDGTRYRYRVRPMLVGGTLAPPSAPVAVTMRDRLAPYAPPFAAAEAGDGRVRIVWQLPPDADVAGFEVERRRGGGDSTWRRLTSGLLSATTLELTDSTVRGGSIYAWRVRAVDRAGNPSPWSTPATARAVEYTPPDAPRAVTATVAKRRATYRWRPPVATDVAGYHVYRTQVPGARVRLTGLPVAATVFVDSAAAGAGLMPGAAYRIEVTAVDSAENESVAASAELVVPDDDVPEAPRSADARGRFGGSVTVTWSASPALDVVRYEVDAREGTGPARPVARTGGRGPFIAVDTAAKDDVALTYRVVAVDSAGNRSEPATATITKRDEERPSAPRAVLAIRQGDVVRVRWERVASPDLAGYVVLRAASPAGAQVEVGRAATGITELVDRAPTPTAFYTVVAIDRSGNRSFAPPLVPLQVEGR